MLKFSIALPDLARDWNYADGRWASGGSWIEPLSHPMLEVRTATDGHGWVMTVRERQAGVPHTPHAHVTPDALADEVEIRKAWPLDSVSVHVECDRVSVRAGHGGSAPLYLAHAGGVLVGSWDLADLKQYATSDGLVAREVARLLGGHHRYGHGTVLPGVSCLTVGSTARFDRGGLTLDYPEPVGEDQPRSLLPGADPVSAFETLLGHTVGMRPLGDGCAVQLSGGQDSATVALTVGRNHPGVRAAAMVLPGAVGEQQADRRACLVAAARLVGDVRVAALAHPPLAMRRIAPDVWSPYDEPYGEALRALAERAAHHGVHTMITGFGGDELMAVRGHRQGRVRDDAWRWLGPVTLEAAAERDRGIAPQTAVPETALLAVRTASPVLLRAGMWPVSPLTDLNVVRFARWLPDEWHADKRLFRERLRRCGLPEWVVRPVLRENFTDVMAHSMHVYGPRLLRQIAADSPLVEWGFLDPAGLRAVADACASGPAAAREHTAAYAPIALDLFVRALG
ncbi:hypothetical protein HUF15_40260 [Streptomyces samsunensis]|uniref:asparagine synthase-related protein n=1 Tax=Streptomyces malaysiensis TaxID=92644 RepID=UPI0015817478|nr:asparagine synthase-related protein [Streptomyces samsunensis]NUH42859.1 hypothetical protein [Streptomyces samsunensis]